MSLQNVKLYEHTLQNIQIIHIMHVSFLAFMSVWECLQISDGSFPFNFITTRIDLRREYLTLLPNTLWITRYGVKDPSVLKIDLNHSELCIANVDLGCAIGQNFQSNGPPLYIA